MTDPVRVLTESVQVPIPDGPPMGGYLARPAAPGPGGAVIVGMELFGVSAHVRDVCDRLATLGYTALAPDLYHRTAPNTELAADDTGRTRGFALLHQLTRAQTLEDVGATIGYIRGQNIPLAGMVGLSVGGHIAYLSATRFDIPATVVLYGGWIPTTDIPISRPTPTIDDTHAITGQVLILVGEDDSVVPPGHRRAIAAALHAAGVTFELIEYPGTGHAFLCDRRNSYHHQSAQDAWTRINQLLTPIEPVQ